VRVSRSAGRLWLLMQIGVRFIGFRAMPSHFLIVPPACISANSSISLLEGLREHLSTQLLACGLAHSKYTNIRYYVCYQDDNKRIDFSFHCMICCMAGDN
jgi:hypothetical protein